MDNIRISIPVREYRELVECAAMVSFFRKYMHTQKYGPDRRMYDAIPDFEASEDEWVL